MLAGVLLPLVGARGAQSTERRQAIASKLNRHSIPTTGRHADRLGLAALRVLPRHAPPLRARVQRYAPPNPGFSVGGLRTPSDPFAYPPTHAPRHRWETAGPHLLRQAHVRLEQRHHRPQAAAPLGARAYEGEGVVSLLGLQDARAPIASDPNHPLNIIASLPTSAGAVAGQGDAVPRALRQVVRMRDSPSHTSTTAL